jgi:predicted RNA-binding protein with PUA-like domain
MLRVSGVCHPCEQHPDPENNGRPCAYYDFGDARAAPRWSDPLLRRLVGLGDAVAGMLQPSLTALRS